MDNPPRDETPSNPEQVASFEAMFRATFDDVTRFAARRLREPADVADSVAATYAAAFTSWQRFDETKGPAIAWLYGIARNVIAGELRRRRQFGHAIRLASVEELVAPDEYERIGEVIDAVRLAPALEAILVCELTQAERELLRLVCEDELSIAEAGRVLGISPVAARMRLARARRRVLRAVGRFEGGIEALFRGDSAPYLTPAVRRNGQ